LYLMIALVFFFLIGRRLSGPWGGLAAFTFVSFYPVVYVWSRLYYCDVAVMMTGAIGCFLLLQSDRFTRLSYAAAYGLWAALAPRFGWTVSDAVAALMVVLAPALPAAAAGLFANRGAARRRALFGLALALVGFLVLFNFRWAFAALNYLRYEGVELARTKYIGGNVLVHPESLFAYLPVIFRILAGPAWTLAFLLTLPLYFRRPSWEKLYPLCWLLLPLRCCRWSRKKNQLRPPADAGHGADDGRRPEFHCGKTLPADRRRPGRRVPAGRGRLAICADYLPAGRGAARVRFRSSPRRAEFF
jgi:hypothetical protein